MEKKYLHFLLLVIFLNLFLFATIELHGQNNSLTFTPTGTGQTTGHVVTLTIHHQGNDSLLLKIDPKFIPATDNFQGYIIDESYEVHLPPNGMEVINLSGYCTDVFRPAVPKGHLITPFEQWISQDKVLLISPLTMTELSPRQGFFPRKSARRKINQITFPGTSTPIDFSINFNQYPQTGAGLLFNAIENIKEKYDSLYQNNQILTPYKKDPFKEKASVIQHTFWIYTAGLSGLDYTFFHFENRTIEQFEKNKNDLFATTAPSIQRDLFNGVHQFWNTFQTLGQDAGVLLHNSSTPNYWQLLALRYYEPYAIKRKNNITHEQAMLTVPDFLQNDFNDYFKSRYQKQNNFK